MTIDSNIPSNARKVIFAYGRGSGMLYIWETNQGKWQWSAMGNTGEEDSANKAISAAREWIINDYDKTQRRIE